MLCCHHGPRGPVATVRRATPLRAAAAGTAGPAHGWRPDQFGCLNSIWVRENGWNERAGHQAWAY